jgi:hypothetical protein
MAWLRKLFKRKADASQTESRPTGGARVTGNRLWACPKCRTLLEKKALGTAWNPGDPVTRVSGTATCGSCLSVFDQVEVYGGKYDVEGKAKKGNSLYSKEVAVLAFQMFSMAPPSNPREICSDLLKRRHPKAWLGQFYMVGRVDSIAPDEALAQYREYVRIGQLPDLGTQFDSYTEKDISGKQIAILLFK